jgi:3-hydroxyacyl-CoA dehydrogenase
LKSTAPCASASTGNSVPFELWDAAGVEATVARMKKEGKPVAANVEKLLAAGQKSWYTDDPKTASGRKYWQLATGNWQPVEVPAGVWSTTVAKKSHGVVKKNSGASLIDLGDGVACLEFHSKMNSLGADIISLISQTLKPGGPGDAFDAFVITNDATNFSVGANLMLLLMSVQEDEWDDVDLAIRQFQGMTQAIKFSPKPVVAAPFGLCLGGGTEISLHAAARQPHAELYAGLGRSRRRPAPRRRRLQGNAAARRRQRRDLARQSLPAKRWPVPSK